MQKVIETLDLLHKQLTEAHKLAKQIGYCKIAEPEAWVNRALINALKDQLMPEDETAVLNLAVKGWIDHCLSKGMTPIGFGSNPVEDKDGNKWRIELTVQMEKAG